MLPINFTKRSFRHLKLNFMKIKIFLLHKKTSAFIVKFYIKKIKKKEKTTKLNHKWCKIWVSFHICSNWMAMTHSWLEMVDTMVSFSTSLTFQNIQSTTVQWIGIRKFWASVLLPKYFPCNSRRVSISHFDRPHHHQGRLWVVVDLQELSSKKFKRCPGISWTYLPYI